MGCKYVGAAYTCEGLGSFKSHKLWDLAELIEHGLLRTSLFPWVITMQKYVWGKCHEKISLLLPSKESKITRCSFHDR